MNSKQLRSLNLQQLCQTLMSKKIQSVVITFDGSGDSGQIESVTAFNTEDEESDVQFEDITFKQFTNDKDFEETRAVEFLEDLAYDALETCYDGWEINDGSYGEIIFDVSTANTLIKFNERITDVRSSEKYIDTDGDVIEDDNEE